MKMFTVNQKKFARKLIVLVNQITSPHQDGYSEL